MDFNYILGGSDSADLQCHLGVCDYINSTIDSDVPQLKRATIFENIIHYVIWFPNLCNTGYAILRSMDFIDFGPTVKTPRQISCSSSLISVLTPCSLFILGGLVQLTNFKILILHYVQIFKAFSNDLNSSLVKMSKYM